MAFIQAVPWHSITTPTQRRNGTLRNAAAAGTPGAVLGTRVFSAPSRFLVPVRQKPLIFRAIADNEDDGRQRQACGCRGEHEI